MLKRLSVIQQKTVLSRASELSTNLYSGKKLGGQLRGLHSMRIGDLRLIYYIDFPKDVVWLVGVGPRESIYE